VLKKLRVKFVLVNMTIVFIMIGFIFGVLYFSTVRNVERESIQFLESIVMSPVHAGPPDMGERVQFRFLCIVTNENDIIISKSGSLLDDVDEVKLYKYIEECREIGIPTGELKDEDLKYTYIETPRENCYAFVDVSAERVIMNSMIRSFILIGSGAIAAFLIISIFLSKWAVKPVETAWKQQKQFVADASHELKTPLTVIMTDAELLNSAGCSEDDRIFLSDSIMQMSAQMRGLVDSMLELARVDSGSLIAVKEKVIFSETVSNSAMSFEPVLFEKGLLFSYDVASDIEIMGNGTQLKQLVDILLDNAGKYASDNGIVIMKLEYSKHNHCLLSVSNTGDPIADEELDNLFKRFYRADKARVMNNSYGLGLSIAESIVREHGGRIWAESEKGYNNFYVELPV